MSNQPDTGGQIPRRKFLGRCAVSLTAAPLAGTLAATTSSALAADEPDADKETAAELPKAVKLPADELDREIAALLKLVDPKLRYEPTKVDPAKNAWPLWEKAAKTWSPDPEDAEYSEAYEAFVDGKLHPTAPGRDRIRKWFESNAEFLKLGNEAVARPALQFPWATERPSPWPTFTDLQWYKNFAQLKAVQVRMMLDAGDVRGAFDAACVSVRSGAMLLQADATFLHLLVARVLLEMGVNSLYTTMMSPAASAELAQAAIEQLAAASPTYEHLKQVLRVEFCHWFVPALAGFPHDANVRDLAVGLVEMAQAAVPTPDEHAAYLTGIDRIATLLGDHRRAFDKVATLKYAATLHLETFAELKFPPLKRTERHLQRLKDELVGWPIGASPSSWMFGRLKLEEFRPSTEEELSKAKTALREVENPVGKELVSNLCSALFHTGPVDDTRAHLDAVRLRIALRLFERKHRRLPAKLDELVAEKVLPAVPVDPFDGEPFRYSAKRRVVWSVDVDGENEGELPESVEGEPESGPGRRMTWRVPTLAG